MLKTFRQLILLVLIWVFPLCVIGQENLSSQLMGLWSIPVKGSHCDGLIIIEFGKNRSLNGTMTFNLNNCPNVAFTRGSGVWELENNTIKLVPYESSSTRKRWTLETANYLESNPEFLSQAKELLDAIEIPDDKELKLSEYMIIRNITATKLTLQSDKGYTPIVFTRIKEYPKGGVLTFPREEKKENKDGSPKDTRSAGTGFGRFR